jgi:hypothetical protein
MEVDSMSDQQAWSEIGAVELRAYRAGKLVHQQLYESAQQAAAAAEQWEQLEGVECEVDDLSREHRLEDAASSDLSETIVDDRDFDR